MCINKHVKYVKRVAVTRHADMTFDHPVYLVMMYSHVVILQPNQAACLVYKMRICTVKPALKDHLLITTTFYQFSGVYFPCD